MVSCVAPFIPYLVDKISSNKEKIISCVNPSGMTKSSFYYYLILIILVLVIIYLVYINYYYTPKYKKITVYPLNQEFIPDLEDVNKEFDKRRYDDYKQSKKSSTGEQITAQAFEDLLSRGVKRCCRDLKFLINPKTGKRLEIDLYDPIYKIGVEYNGPHHYEFPNDYHRTQEDFYDQLYRDDIKRKLCDKHGIYLIPVSYLVDDIKKTPEERYILIKNYLHSELSKIGVV